MTANKDNGHSDKLKSAIRTAMLTMFSEAATAEATDDAEKADLYLGYAARLQRMSVALNRNPREAKTA